jgi:hypothetical protein
MQTKREKYGDEGLSKIALKAAKTRKKNAKKKSKKKKKVKKTKKTKPKRSRKIKATPKKTSKKTAGQKAAETKRKKYGKKGLTTIALKAVETRKQREGGKGPKYALRTGSSGNVMTHGSSLVAAKNRAEYLSESTQKIVYVLNNHTGEVVARFRSGTEIQ